MSVFHISSNNSPERVTSLPDVVIDDTPYYFSTLYSSPVLPDGSVLIGVVNDEEGHTNHVEITTHGVGVGSEIYQNDELPGWVFTLSDGALRRFTVWELACPMLRFNDALYISTNYYESCGDARAYGPLSPSQFTDEFKPVGKLFFGAYDTVPAQNFEVSIEFYNNSQLYCSEREDSTVYAEIKNYQGITWREAFYKASKIPLDYSDYIKEKGN